MFFGLERVGRAFPRLVESLEDEGQDAGLLGPRHQVAVVVRLQFLRGVLGVHAATVRAGGPAGFGDDDRRVGVQAGHAVEVLARVVERFVNGLVLPQRVSVQRDEIELGHQLAQLALPGHVVLAEGHRLGHGSLDPAHVLDHLRHRHQVVGPVDGGLVAHRDREHDRGVAAGQCDQALDLGLVLALAGLELRWRERGAPGAARVVQLGPEVGTEHHLERQAIALDDVEHALGVRAAVVQAQQPPVLAQDRQVGADLGPRRVGLVSRALATAVARVADRVSGRECQHQGVVNLDTPCLSHKPQQAPTSPSAPTFQASSKAAK